MMDFERCSELCSGTTIVVEENNRKLTISRDITTPVRKVRVDHCLINDDRPRCDFLFEVYEPSSHVIYVELKGRDVEKGYDQLVATLGYLHQRHKAYTKECFIICSKVPRSGPKVQNLKTEMARKHKAQLYVNTTQGFHTLKKN